MADEVERLRFEVIRLNDALLFWGRHLDWCKRLEDGRLETPCTCGWEVVWDGARRRQEGGHGGSRPARHAG